TVNRLPPATVRRAARRTGRTHLLTATTTAPNLTATLNQITPMGGDLVVDWGDGSAPTVIAEGNTDAVSHAYAAAGSYKIRIDHPELISVFVVRDDAGEASGPLTLGKLNTRILRDSPITWFEVYALVDCILNSADMVGWTGITRFHVGLMWQGDDRHDQFDTRHMAGWTSLEHFALYSVHIGPNYFDTADLHATQLKYFRVGYITAPGTYVVDSGDFAGNTVLEYFWMWSMPAGGTYTIDTADIGTTVLTHFAVQDMPAGSYTIDTADLGISSHIAWFALVNMPSPNSSYRVDSSDLSASPMTEGFEFYGGPSGGTYVLDSADMTGWDPLFWYAQSLPAGTYRIDTSDFVGFTRIGSVHPALDAGRYLYDQQCRHGCLGGIGPGTSLDILDARIKQHIRAEHGGFPHTSEKFSLECDACCQHHVHHRRGRLRYLDQVRRFPHGQ
ncbi:MAG: hypothetical protein M5R40_06480, partial [Anaerolineae bacterium]|nr:hypothetical protein [Anaerolineae bacterium]